MSKIKKVISVGERETYDLEVNHPDHQFYLENGILCSNSHSIAYSHNSYYTAYLKCHYPLQFMTALLNSENPNDDKIQRYIDECARLGINILPPHINLSKSNFCITSDTEITTGLEAIKGVGDTAIVDIISQQPFTSFSDLLARTTGRLVNKRVIEALAKAGALDCFGRTRKDIVENHQKYRAKINDAKKKSLMISDSLIPAVEQNEWTQKEILMAEKEVLGRTISGSLHDVYKDFFKKDSSMVTYLDKIATLRKGVKVKVEVIIKNLAKEIKIKNGPKTGQKFAKYAVQDVYGNVAEMTVWPEDYQKYRDAFKDGTPIKAICQISEYMGQKSLSLSTLERKI